MSTNEALATAAAALRADNIDPLAITPEQADELIAAGDLGDITDGDEFTTGVGIGRRGDTYMLGLVIAVGGGDHTGTEQAIEWADGSREG